MNPPTANQAERINATPDQEKQMRRAEITCDAHKQAWLRGNNNMPSLIPKKELWEMTPAEIQWLRSYLMGATRHIGPMARVRTPTKTGEAPYCTGCNG